MTSRTTISASTSSCVFCKEVGTEPYIAVNTGLGSVADAADEVEYANGAAPQPAGAPSGPATAIAEPYRVTWWGIGNEMYGDWQLGNVPVERYALRHNAFVAAMRAKDPGIQGHRRGRAGQVERRLPARLRREHGPVERSPLHRAQVPHARSAPRTPRSTRSTSPPIPATLAGGVRGIVADCRKRLGGKNPALNRVPPGH